MNEAVHHFQVDGAGTTVLHPLGFVMLLVCGMLLIALPRKYATWPLIILACFVSSRQCIAIAGLNLYLMRVMVLFFGSIRVVVRNEIGGFRWTALDWTVLAYGAFYFLTGAINFGFSLAEIKFRAGSLVEIIGLYFLLRVLIRTKEDGVSLIKGLAIVSIPLACFFVLEQMTGRNVFAIFGGVSPITMIREGRMRCQGAFGHPILAGVVWAVFLPLLIYAIFALKKQRFLFVIAFLAGCLIIITCASSTPFLGLVVAVVGMAAYRFRRSTRMALAATGVMLVVLHFVMKAPVWHLIARINVTAGNSGYHRFLLVDGFINHWDEWFFLGSRVGSAHWGHYTHDAANQFVVAGLQGGILCLGLFITIIVQALLATERITKRDSLLGWAIGIAIAVHCFCFLGISIWGQLHFSWAIVLAMAGSLQLMPMPVKPSKEDVALLVDKEAVN